MSSLYYFCNGWFYNYFKMKIISNFKTIEYVYILKLNGHINNRQVTGKNKKRTVDLKDWSEEITQNPSTEEDKEMKISSFLQGPTI